MVTLTDTASNKVKELLNEHKDEGELFLRIYVTGGGCSGLSYGMSLDEKRDNDQVIETGGVTLIIDPVSAQYLNGCEIDYKDAFMGGGFAISNPNATRTCGCGQSFQTAEDQGSSEMC